MIRVFALASILASPALAHDFEELVISSFNKDVGDYYAIELQDTAAGRDIICAIYDDAGKLLTSDTQITDNLATRVLIRYEGSDVARARCVFND